MPKSIRRSVRRIKFRIDECLSPDLALLARERGYFESNFVGWIGLGSLPDHVIIKFVLRGNWTFVTSNVRDFLPRPDSSSLHYTRVNSHSGLICLCYNNILAEEQVGFFQQVLDQIEMQELEMANKSIIAVPDSGSLNGISISVNPLP